MFNKIIDELTYTHDKIFEFIDKCISTIDMLKINENEYGKTEQKQLHRQTMNKLGH